MDGAPSTTDMYPAICAWTDPHTLFMDVSSMSDQYQQPSGLSYGYVPIPSIAWPSIPGVEYSYSTASLAQAEAFPEIGAPSQPFSSSFLCPSRQIASVNPRNPKKSRPKFTDDDKREICQYHEFNKQAKHQEIADFFRCERSTITKILGQKKKYRNSFISEQDLGPDFADPSKSGGAMEPCENSSFKLVSEADSMSTVVESPLNSRMKKKGKSCRDKQADESKLLGALDCIERYFESTCDGLTPKERGAISNVREQIFRS